MKWFHLVWVFLIASCSGTQPAKDHATLAADMAYEDKLDGVAQQAYLAGKTLILYGYDERFTTTEAFADWQFYFQQHVDSEDASIFTGQIAPEKLHALVGLADVSTEFTLFIKRGYPTYFYEDFILEPQVYKAVDAAYDGVALSPEDHAFLPEQVQNLQ